MPGRHYIGRKAQKQIEGGGEMKRVFWPGLLGLGILLVFGGIVALFLSLAQLDVISAPQGELALAWGWRPTAAEIRSCYLLRLRAGFTIVLGIIMAVYSFWRLLRDSREALDFWQKSKVPLRKWDRVGPRNAKKGGR